MPSHEALSVSPHRALEISSVVGHPPSLDRNHCSTSRVVVESHKHDERCGPSSQKPQYPTLYRRFKPRLGCSLRANKGSVVRQGKKATHKCSRVEGSFSGPLKVQGPVSKPNSVGCYRQLNSSSLHKQTRRNPLGGDVCSPVEDHGLVPSLPDNLKSQTHSRVSECDGRPSVQVEPSPVNRMITASTGVETDLSQVVHSSYRSICHSSEPQSPTVHFSSHNQNTWDIDALNINWSGLSSQQRSHFNYQCQELFINSPTTLCFTAIHNISTSTPGV